MESQTVNSPIRLLIVDDHPVVRAGLITMLRRQSVLKVVGAVESGAGRVPHVRLSVRGPKKTGDPDFLLRGTHQRPRVRLSVRKAA
jgi:hypothetical protein